MITCHGRAILKGARFTYQHILIKFFCSLMIQYNVVSNKNIVYHAIVSGKNSLWIMEWKQYRGHKNEIYVNSP